MVEPWCVARGIRIEGFLIVKVRIPTILDHKELMGDELGRKGILPSLPGQRHVWNEHHGVHRSSDIPVSSMFIFISRNFLCRF